MKIKKFIICFCLSLVLVSSLLLKVDAKSHLNDGVQPWKSDAVVYSDRLMTSCSWSSHVEIQNNGNDWAVMSAYVRNGLIGRSKVSTTLKFVVRFQFGGIDSSGVMHEENRVHDYR